MTDQPRNSHSIAIIGMAGRFPGAKNIEALWQLLKSGRHSVTVLSDAELEAAGVAPALINDPRYVKTCVHLDGYDRFDAGFFGYTPKQATSMDPQGRLFLECAWEALEHAGYDPATYGGVIGIFAGSGTNHYLQRYLQEIVAANGGSWYQTALDGEKDFLTMRVSYKLGLNGPSVAVQSACSTSLVAVHMACQSLLTFESDIVLAGAVTIQEIQHSGYLHEAGGIASSDGFCRAYDADATGTIEGSGCGIVVLKRLEEAIRDGDEIHAVIRSSAVNNDGADKAGFSAPGTKAQTRLIAAALAFAELEPTDIGMLEGHGTGTVLGDAVELAALGEAFATSAPAQKWCALGSIKSNIGHLDTAAGIAGLIKAVLCLKHAHFVPSLHFSRPNPALQSSGSPFFVSTGYTPWPSHGKPRRAGVSAFGMGGTNAHVIVEEAPLPPAGRAAILPQVFPLSAHTDGALQQLCSDLACLLEERPQIDLADVAHTLQTGRRRFAYRRAIVAATSQELVRALREPQSSGAPVCHDPHADRPVIFLFPGQGSQRPDAVRALYASEAFFRTQVDDCAAAFEARLGFDIRPHICKAEAADSRSSINSTLITQPAVFTVGYSLARLWMHWGVMPSGLVGHSVGEYVAACISGVLSLQDCIRLLARRATVVSDLLPGTMLAVRMPADGLRPLLADTLSIAAINSPSQCVISGSSDDIEALSQVLLGRAVEHRRLPVSHAFHSRMMDRAMPALEEAAQGCRFEAPRLPYVSCVTGKRAVEADVTDPKFWSRHLREPVNFAAALANSAAGGAATFLEVGSGRALCGLARQQFGDSGDYSYVESLPSGHESDRVELLAQLGLLWSYGARLDWQVDQEKTPRRRVGLVAYPFQRQRYWIHKNHDRRPLAGGATPVWTPAGKFAAAGEWTELEASIATLWADVLGVETIRRSDTFMSLGGDSLIALRVIARIDDQFGVRISSRALISSSCTVEVLAAQIVTELASSVDEAQMSEYLSEADASMNP